jgi:hypothetical protein
MSKLGFGLMDEKPSSGENELVPAGWYNIWLTNEEFVDNKNKNGKILKCTFEVLSGHYKGSTIFENFNVINNSEVAQRIGRAELSAFAVAAGVPNVDDSSILLKRPIKAKIKIEAYAGKDRVAKHSNRIAAYRNVQEDIPTVETQQELILPSLHIAETPALPVGAPIPAWTMPSPGVTPPGIMQNPPPAPGAQPAILGNAPVQPWQQAASPVQQPVQESAPVQQAQVQQHAAPAWAPPVQQATPVQQAAPVQQPEAPVQQAAPEVPFDPGAKPAWMQNK